MELELKLDATPEALDRILHAPILGEATFVPHAQRSVYYDTPDRALRAAGLTLRIRRSGDGLVQTVKAEGTAAAGLFARGEWETELGEERPLLDAGSGLVSTLLPDLRADTLAPVFTVEVTRLRAMLRHAGAEIELVVDRGEVIAGAARLPVSELELELVSGPPAALFSLAHALNAVAPLQLGVETKSARGHALLDQRRRDRAVKAERTPLSGEMSAADAFVRIAATCLHQFRLNEALLLRTRKEEALHQARVAVRRLRSAFSIFRPIVEDDRFATLRDELRWLAGILGEARDIDVLLTHVEGDLHTRLQAARTAAYDAAEQALASHRARTLMIGLAEWLAVGAWRQRPETEEGREAPARLFAAAALDRLRRRIRRRGKRLAQQEDEGRHRIRILAKKLRYAAEFFRGLFPGGKAQRRADAFIAAVEGLQEQLGELNDMAHGPHVLARLGLHPAAPPEAGRRDRLLHEAARARRNLLDTRRFWR